MSWKIITACLLVILFNPAKAALIDFEIVPGGTPADQLVITTQYLATQGVSFALSFGGAPTLEMTGGSDTGDGFINDQEGEAPDVEATGLEGELGDFYLRIGTTQLLSAPVPDLIISYVNPVNAASAQIWDIDGRMDATEQWRVTALDSTDTVIDTLLSPVGEAFDATSLDALPWTWSFSHGSDDISKIRIAFVGTKATSIGLAFDNFSPFTATIPVPGAMWLLGSALGLLGWMKRRKVA